MDEHRSDDSISYPPTFGYVPSLHKSLGTRNLLRVMGVLWLSQMAVEWLLLFTPYVLMDIIIKVILKRFGEA